ncbi:MAG: hypothetical protein J0I86_04805 [Mesorhizobium sp.]|nr:hypothetical protein [Mesorhizobium sp.]
MRDYACCGLAAALLAICTGSAASGEIAACSISAWSTDLDPGGLNVRAGPGTDTAVVARLPAPLEVDGYTFGAEVSITGSKDGWFRIEKAVLEDYVGDQKTEVLFEGEGWVSGRLLSLTVNAIDLRRDPSSSAPVVTRLIGEDAEGVGAGPDSFAIERLEACEGNWVKIKGTFLGKPFSGWTTGTCSNQVTTCP